jgi:hypothetical protein
MLEGHRRVREVSMSTHQYAQHDWPPMLFAVLLLVMAVFFVVGMGLFLLAANREQRGTTARHAPRGGTPGPVPH